MHTFTEEVKAKWLEALRSGRYAQGRGALCRVKPDGSRSFCCLGVLADTLGLLVPDPTSRTALGVLNQNGGSDWVDGGSDWVNGGWFGAPEHHTQGGLWGDLASMNDCGKTFAEIADHIEKNVPADGSELR